MWAGSSEHYAAQLIRNEVEIRQFHVKTAARRKLTRPGMGCGSQGKCAELGVVEQVGVEVGEEAAGERRSSVKRLVAVQVDERD